MDPNFPPALNIFPLAPVGVQYESNNQKEAIEKYGIAGRVWEATRPLVQYFTPTAQAAYDPPCPVFEHASPRRIVELGSGQGLASLHLASFLDKTDNLVLTDLENVIPLCQLSIDNWRGTRDDVPAVQAQAMGWGDDSSRVRSLGPFDFILMCDLVSGSSSHCCLRLTHRRYTFLISTRHSFSHFWSLQSRPNRYLQRKRPSAPPSSFPVSLHSHSNQSR